MSVGGQGYDASHDGGWIKRPGGSKIQNLERWNHCAIPQTKGRGAGARLAAWWQSFVGELGRRGRTFGSSPSTSPHGFTGATVERDYSIPGMVAFLERFTAEKGLPGAFALAGHSMGGHVAWRFALEYPERVAKLALIAPGGLAAPGGPLERPFRVARMAGGGLLLKLASSQRAMAAGMRGGVFDPTRITDDMVGRHWSMSRRPGAQDAMIARLKAKTTEPAAIARLGDLTMPLLLLWGENDPVFPLPLSRSFVDVLPQTKCIVYERCGHFPLEEHPDQVARDLATFLGVDVH